MSKLEEIENLLKQWKACKPPEEDARGIISIKKCKGGVIALEQALAIIKRPSNKKLNPKQATEEEIIDAWVNFMMDTSFGGE